MYRISFKSRRVNEVQVLPFAKSKVIPFACIIDNYDSQPFNLNDHGFIRNDISQLARAQSQSEYEAMLRKLTTMPERGSLPDDISIADAIATIRPRNMQSPVELEVFAQSLAARDMERLNAAYEKSLASQQEPAKVEPAVQTPSD